MRSAHPKLVAKIRRQLRKDSAKRHAARSRLIVSRSKVPMCPIISAREQRRCSVYKGPRAAAPCWQRGLWHVEKAYSRRDEQRSSWYRAIRDIEPCADLNRHFTSSRLDARPTDPLGRESRSGDQGRYLTGIDVTVGGAGLVVEGRRKAARAGSQCPELYDPPNLMGPTPRTFGMDSRGWKSSRLILRSRRV